MPASRFQSTVLLPLALLLLSEVLLGTSTDCVRNPKGAGCGTKGISFQRDTAQATTPGNLLPAGRQGLLGRVISLNRLAETMRSAG
ncbi:MAG TPA: hypothetical protein VHP35_20300, partial [Terriglobia bacterium]|nr:hypothetical protein [Terriglobia bacterium]